MDERLSGIVCDTCENYTLKLTGEVGYTLPVIYFYKCQNCGHNGWVKGDEDINVLRDVDAVKKRPNLYWCWSDKCDCATMICVRCKKLMCETGGDADDCEICTFLREYEGKSKKDGNIPKKELLTSGATRYNIRRWTEGS